MTFWGTIGRLILVPLAFVIAVCTSVFVLFTLGTERITQAMQGRDLEYEAVPGLMAFAFDMMIVFSGFTLLPAILLVIVGEVARIRSSIYYIIGGGVVLVLIPVLANFGASQSVQMPTTVVWQVFASAGFAGGLVYWLLAGRTA